MLLALLATANYNADFKNILTAVLVPEDVFRKLTKRQMADLRIKFDGEKPFIETALGNLEKISAKFETIRKSN